MHRQALPWRPLPFLAFGHGEGLKYPLRYPAHGILQEGHPVFQQPIADMHIEGFVPIIINVTPINLQFILGLADDPDSEEQKTRDTEAGDNALMMEDKRQRVQVVA